MLRQIAHYDPYGSAVARGTYGRSKSTDMRTPSGALGQMTDMQRMHVVLVMGGFLAGALFATQTKTGRRWFK